jgi:hypothetical protein
MRKVTLSIFMIIALTTGFGCSTHSRTVTSETREYPVERRTETTTETRSESGGGVLSSTVDVVGEVIALPFRAVGGLIRGIF